MSDFETSRILSRLEEVGLSRAVGEWELERLKVALKRQSDFLRSAEQLVSESAPAALVFNVDDVRR